MNAAALKSDRRFEFLLSENLVTRLADRQLARLHEVDSLSNVALHVLPNGNGTEHPGVGFTIYDYDDGVAVVLELPHAQVEVTGRQEVAVYQERWSDMWKRSRKLT